ncbi:unnamed protein product [Wickerhamomyces anomalus]
MSSTLEERLKNNSSAFDGLLSLIPAKYYYDDDTQNQWKAKKQSKEEAKEAKRAKLDPVQSEQSDQSASASQVLKKRAKTAKPVVIPGSKLIQKPIVEEENDDEEEEEEIEEESNEEEAKPVKQTNQKKDQKKEVKPKDKSQKVNGFDEEDEEEENINIMFDDEGNEVDFEQPKPKDESTGNSVEVKEEEKKKKDESIKLLREKLASKINALKEKRKAPGSKAAGAPSSREAILEERHEDENSDEDEESDDGEEDDGMSADNVLYQNIRFNDDERTTSDLQNLRKHSKKKGPAKKDLKAHLKLVEAKKQKLAQLDQSELKEQNEKDKWNTVIAQAEGEKLRNDEKLLRKALKRKDAQKRKSEFEWKERKETVENSISAKQKRREENLQIRKDNKGIKRKNQAKQKRKFKGAIVPKRAGFEGRRSRK